MLRHHVEHHVALDNPFCEKYLYTLYRYVSHKGLSTSRCYHTGCKLCQIIIAILLKDGNKTYMVVRLPLLSQEMYNKCYLCKLEQVTRFFFISYSTQLSMKFILLINVKMSPIGGILTFISMINTTSEGLKVRNVFIFQNFGVHDHLKFISQLSVEHEK